MLTCVNLFTHFSGTVLFLHSVLAARSAITLKNTGLLLMAVFGCGRDRISTSVVTEAEVLLIFVA